MKKGVAFALYCSGGNISKAFEWLEELFFTNYDAESFYGIIIDPPPSAVFEGVCDVTLAEEAKRGVQRLSRLYGSCFFAMLRKRQYDPSALRNGYYRYACEGGMFCATDAFLKGLAGEQREFSQIYGEQPFCKMGLLLDNKLFENKNIAFRCDALMPLLRKPESHQVGIKKAKCVAFSAERETLFLISEGKIFTSKTESVPYLPSSQEKFLLKNAAITASKYFFEMYDGKIPLPESLRELELMLCAIVSMKMFGCLGEAEASSFSDKVLCKIKRIIAITGDSGIDGDDLLLLSAAAEGICEVMEAPEFILLKSEMLELKTKLAKMHKSRFGGELSGALCCKEYKACSGKMSKIACVLLFSLDMREFLSFLSGKIGRGNAEFNSYVLICAAQIAFGTPFKLFLQKNKEINARIGLLTLAERTPNSEFQKIEGQSLWNATQAAGELLQHFEQFQSIKKRLLFAGACKSSLPYVAYLEGCVKNSEQKTVCFACDKIDELIFSLVGASKAVQGLSITVVSPDIYGSKKLLSVFPSVNIENSVSPESLKTKAREFGFFRQITPYSTLKELMNELKSVKQKNK